MTITLREVEFMAQVTELAELRGWQWVHFRPGRTEHGWRTPVSGPLGKGWPDLFMVRQRDKRMIFAELKRDGVKPSLEQVETLALLESVGVTLSHHWDQQAVPVEVCIWRPADWEQIEATLK